MPALTEEVVISGVGGFFPKSRNIEELQENLMKDEHLLEARWSYGERGCTNLMGAIDVRNFDNAYFGIHRQQSTYMDPMQRLVMERTFEALIDAGVNPGELRGRRIGCFMGSSIGENDNLFLESVISGFGVTGHSRAMMPNRISYWLNIKGPSIAYDSNWIGGFEIVRLACEAINSGQCEAVVVGTANLALNSEFQYLYSDLGFISSDGSTKAFDAKAEGYARSDGVVVLYIQKKSEARRSYATIVNAQTMFNGNRDGTLLDISVDSMSKFIDNFYQKAGVDPREVEYVEAYGCGVKKIDKKELEALEKVYCKDRKHPLLVGSVKPHTGHAEAASGLFAVVKALIALEKLTIPATIQHKNPNLDIEPLAKGTIKVVTENLKWGAKYAAVNGIGINSYYGHILLKGNPKISVEKTDDIPRLVIASSRTEVGIKEILELIKDKNGASHEYVGLTQQLFSKPINSHLYRGYVMLGNEGVKQESEYHLGNKRQLWFVYSGMGSQWAGMASDLMKIPIFESAIQKCHKILEPEGIDLLNIITTEDKSIFDNILNSFVGIAAIQIGLTDILHAIGLSPDGIIGHSVGELGCAYADGCMTAEQMIMSAYSRGRASLETELIQGMMAAIGMGYEQIKDKCPPSIEVACHNGPDSSTISGPTEDMEKFVKELQDQGTFARLVNVSNIAYHSRYIKPAAPKLLEYLKKVLPKAVPRTSKWISTSNLEENWNSDLARHSSAEYHTNNLLSSVLFEEGLKHIPKDSILIEIAPHGLLQAILKRSLKPGCTNIPLTQRGTKSAVEYLLGNVGKMYLSGLDINITCLYPKLEYPVSRGTPTLATLAHWEHSEVWRTGLENKINSSLYGVREMSVSLNSEEFRDCVGYQLDDKVIMPCSTYLNILSDILLGRGSGVNEVVFEDLHFRKYLTIPKIGSISLNVTVQKASGKFEVLGENEILVTGKMSFPLATDEFLLPDTEVEVVDDQFQLSANDIYTEFAHRRHKYSGVYKTIKSLTITDEGSVAFTQWNNKWPLFLEAMIQQYLFQAGEQNQDIRLPKTIQKIAISQGKLPADKSELKVSYRHSTGIIAAEGIQVIGINSMVMPRAPAPISFDSVEFCPYVNPAVDDINFAINAAIHLSMNNFDDYSVSTLMITEIETEESLLDSVKQILDQYKSISPNITTVKDVKQILIQHIYPTLFILNDTVKEDIVNVTAACKGFLLAKTSKEILSFSNIIQVAQFNVGGVSYSLLKKASTTQPKTIVVTGDTLSVKDLNRPSVQWVTDMQAAAATQKDDKRSIFLVSSIIPTEGIPNFCRELRAMSNLTDLRFIFNLDKKITEIKPKDMVYQHLFKQDLVLTVFNERILGTYIPYPVNLKKNVLVNSLSTPNTIDNKVIQYIGVNLKDETINPVYDKPNELSNIDYVVTTTNNQRFMGIARVDYDTYKVVPDPILSWELPTIWTLEDGATVPYAYACAYYALFYKGELKPGQRVLIHGGCTAIGMASISVAASYGCDVYVTIATDWQRAFLKKQFITLTDHNIFPCTDASFEPLFLMATGGKGAHLILSCLSGHLLHATVNCLADFGRLLHFGKCDLEENNSIGMYVFLRNTSFITVDFDNLLNASDEVKKELKDLVQKGIEAISVRPLVRKTVEHQNVDEILSTLKKSSHIGKMLIRVQNSLAVNKFNVAKADRFLCDRKSSYLIYGGTADTWIDLSEWLILRGARRIVVSSDAKSQQIHITRRLSLFQYYFGAEIVFVPCKAHTREGAAELLSEVYVHGPIHGVFILPIKSNLTRASEVKPVQYIDQALRTTAPKALLVNFTNSAAGLCYLRSQAGFNTYNIQFMKSLDFSEVLCGMDNILSYRINNIFVKNDGTNDVMLESVEALFKKLVVLLPQSIDDLVWQTIDAPKEPTFVQLQTNGPDNIRELAPIFLIPGLNGLENVKNLASKLLYPTYMAVLPERHLPVQEMAKKLVEEMKRLWPKGPYSVIGVSTGGILATEITKVLDDSNTSIHLYYIDGAPNTIQGALKHLGENLLDLEINLLARLFNNNEVTFIEKMRSMKNWEERAKLAIKEYQGTLVDQGKLEVVLRTIRDRLLDILNYQPSDYLIGAWPHLLRPFGSSKNDSCGVLSYMKMSLQIAIMPGDHIMMIDNDETVDYINKTFSLV